MNSSISIIINIFVLILGSVGFLTSAGLLLLVFYHRRQHPVNTPLFLICNTCISIIFVSIILIDMYAHYLHADFHDNISFDDGWCYLRAYFLHVNICLLFHSYLIQATFRFFRVVLYRYKKLQTLRFMLQLVLLQWLIGFLCILPLLLLHYFHYIPQDYYCEILLTDIQGMLAMSTITYQLPMVSMGFIYWYILYYMKKIKHQAILQNRRQANQRDLIVLRRIIIQLAMLVTLGFPTVIIWCMYLFTGYANPIGYRLGWSLFTLSVSVLSAVSVYITPQLRELFFATYRHNRRIQPIITVN